jgi:hemolysin III
VSAARLDFPVYTPAEQTADWLVHVVGLASAVIGIVWLASRPGFAATTRQVAVLSVYSFGLIGMLAASAAYNLARAGRLKAALRRLDHSMIFVMIAGSYTPFAMNALDPRWGVPLCGVIWVLAATGIGLKLACQNPHQVLFLALYLGMGWLVLAVLHPLLAVLPENVVLLLFAGGVVYSLGSLVHAQTRMPFHNAIWHGMVLVAAGLHFTAVAQLF